MKSNKNVRVQYDKLSGAYDSLLATQSWWSKLACKIVWGFPNAVYTERLLARLP
jgi:hypothetical protein